MKLKNSVVVAALYCSGKTYFANNTDFSVLDVEAVLAQRRREDRKKNKFKGVLGIRRSLDEYVQCVLDGIGKFDIILINPWKEVLSILVKLKVSYILVYPEKSAEAKEEWFNREKNRSNECRANTVKHFFDSTVKLLDEDKQAKAKIKLSKEQHLSDVVDCIINYSSSDCESDVEQEVKQNNENVSDNSNSEVISENGTAAIVEEEKLVEKKSGRRKKKQSE